MFFPSNLVPLRGDGSYRARQSRSCQKFTFSFFPFSNSRPQKVEKIETRSFFFKIESQMVQGDHQEHFERAHFTKISKNNFLTEFTPCIHNSFCQFFDSLTSNPIPASIQAGVNPLKHFQCVKCSEFSPNFLPGRSFPIKRKFWRTQRYFLLGERLFLSNKTENSSLQLFWHEICSEVSIISQIVPPSDL